MKTPNQCTPNQPGASARCALATSQPTPTTPKSRVDQLIQTHKADRRDRWREEHTANAGTATTGPSVQCGGSCCFSGIQTDVYLGPEGGRGKDKLRRTEWGKVMDGGQPVVKELGKIMKSRADLESLDNKMDIDNNGDNDGDDDSIKEEKICLNFLGDSNFEKNVLGALEKHQGQPNECLNRKEFTSMERQGKACIFCYNLPLGLDGRPSRQITHCGKPLAKFHCKSPEQSATHLVGLPK